MSRYLCRTVETYRVDSEKEAAAAIEEAKKDSKFTLAKYTNEYKERKLKGEVVDAYFKLTLTKDFNDLKEPTTQASVEYTVDSSWMGPTVNDDEEDDYYED